MVTKIELHIFASDTSVLTSTILLTVSMVITVVTCAIALHMSLYLYHISCVILGSLTCPLK